MSQEVASLDLTITLTNTFNHFSTANRRICGSRMPSHDDLLWRNGDGDFAMESLNDDNFRITTWSRAYASHEVTLASNQRQRSLQISRSHFHIFNFFPIGYLKSMSNRVLLYSIDFNCSFFFWRYFRFLN